MAVVTDTSATGAVQTNLTCTSTSCTGQIAAPIGTNTFAASLSDGRGKLLSTGSAMTTIVADQVNNVSLTFDPVVASVVLPTLSAAAGSAQNIPVPVTAFDADNNVIVGPGIYRDSLGNPLTITVTTVDANANTALVGSTKITGPVNTLSLHYTGAHYTTAILTGASSSSNVSVTSGSFASLSIVGTFPFNEPTTGLRLPGWSMTVGPDKAMWVAVGATDGYYLARVAANGSQTFYHFAVPPPATPLSIVSVGGLTSGPGGQLWLTVDGLQSSIQHVTTAGIAGTIGDRSFQVLTDIVAGPDGNLWAIDSQNQSLDKITPAGIVTVYHAPEPNLNQLTFGADKNIYFSGGTQDVIDSFNPTTAVFSQHDFPANPVHLQASPKIVILPQPLPNNVALGPDGNVWFTPYTDVDQSGDLGFVTPAGNVTLFPFNNVTGGLAAGADGNMWFINVSYGMSWITRDGHIGNYYVPQMGEVFNFGVAADGSFWVPTQTYALVHLSF